MPGLRPRAASACASAATSGVLPLPPTVMLPTTTTGTPTRSTPSTPERYSVRRTALPSANSAASGVSTAVSGVSRGAYQSASSRSSRLTARREDSGGRPGPPIAAWFRPAAGRSSIRTLRGERDVDEAGRARGFHHVDHRLVRRVRVRVDDDDRLLRVAGGRLERVGERGDRR